MNPKHQKVTVRIPQEDGSTKINAKSYFERLSYEVEEIEKEVPTTKSTLEKDILTILKHMTEGNALELTMTVKLPTQNAPMRIVKRYMTVRKRY